jgi:hypothetical protein
MSKQITFVIMAALLLTATASAEIFTVKAVNAQSDATSAGDANMTRSILTNVTSGAVMIMPGGK